MAWALGTLITGTPLLKDFNDYVVAQKVWEEPWNLKSGSPWSLLTNPGPAARGSLDDEVYQGISIPNGPTLANVAGGRRFSQELLAKKWRAQLDLTYQIYPQFITPGEIWDEKLAKSSMDELPGLLLKLGREKAYKLSTTQEGLGGMWTRPDWHPSGRYGDEKCRLLGEIQAHLLEPVIDGGHTWQLWTYEEVHKVLELRTHRFLLETGIIRKEALISAGIGAVALEVPQDSIEIRRVEFEYDDLRQKPRALQRIDTLQADMGIVGWDDSTGEPVSYVEDPMVDSMTIRTCPPPNSSGTVSVRYVPMPSFDMQVSCEPLPIPRMFTWAVKWGIISDLLKKEGEANDPVRAAQAEELYTLGVDLAKHLVGART